MDNDRVPLSPTRAAAAAQAAAAPPTLELDGGSGTGAAAGAGDSSSVGSSSDAVPMQEVLPSPSPSDGAMVAAAARDGSAPTTVGLAPFKPGSPVAAPVATSGATSASGSATSGGNKRDRTMSHHSVKSEVSHMEPVVPQSPDMRPALRTSGSFASGTGAGAGASTGAQPDPEMGDTAPAGVLASGGDGGDDGAGGGNAGDVPLGKPLFCGLRYATQHYECMPYEWSVYMADKSQVIDECLAGITVALAQVSESIAFAFIAGVGPLLGLHAAWIIGLSLSLWGSRPGMINGATGVRAAVLAPYVKEHGIGMLFYIVCAISVFQFLAAILKIAKLVRLIPRPAMIGFVNGLAIILALGQVGQFQVPNSPTDEWLDRDVVGCMWFVVVVTVLASVFLPKVPKVGKLLPPSLLGILAATLAEYAIVRPLFSVDTPTIGDIGDLDGGFPKFFFLDPQYDGLIPDLDWETLKTILTPAFIASAAGMVEAVMTMEVVNDLTETHNPNPNQQLLALSIGNFASGMLGTMGGGATIGLSMINCTNGANGRYRISGIVAAIAVLLMVLVASPAIEIIPTASLVGVMVIVCTHTFEWSSLAVVASTLLPQKLRERFNLKRKILRSDALVIVLVTVVTLLLDLFTAVAAGVLFTAAAYAWERGHELRAEATVMTNPDGTKTKVIHVSGDVFFASTMELLSRIRPHEDDPENVEIHFRASQVADFSGMHVLNVLAEQYKQLGKKLHLRHLNVSSTKLLRKADDLAEHFSYDVVVKEHAAEATVEPEEPFRLHVAQPKAYTSRRDVQLTRMSSQGSLRARNNAAAGAKGDAGAHSRA